MVNTGSAGAVTEEPGYWRVVVANRLVYHDVDVTAFGYGQPNGAATALFLKLVAIWLLK